MSWFKKQDETSAPEQMAETTNEVEMSDGECAWCLSEQGIVPRSGSHGICGLHAAQMLEAAHSRAAQRSSRAS